MREREAEENLRARPGDGVRLRESDDHALDAAEANKPFGCFCRFSSDRREGEEPREVET